MLVVSLSIPEAFGDRGLWFAVAYGVVRLGMGMLPEGTVYWAWLVGTIACINIVYGALSALSQSSRSWRARALPVSR